MFRKGNREPKFTLRPQNPYKLSKSLHIKQEKRLKLWNPKDETLFTKTPEYTK